MRRRTIILLAAISAPAVVWLDGTFSATVRRWAAADEVIDGLTGLHALSLGHLVQARVGLNENYDALSRDIAAERKGGAALRALASTSGDPAFTQQVDALEQWRDQRERSLLTFEAANALIRSSDRSRVLMEDRLDGASPGLRAAVGPLSRDLLRYEDQANPEERRRVEGDLAMLRAVGGSNADVTAIGVRVHNALDQADARSRAISRLLMLESEAPYAALYELIDAREQRSIWYGHLLGALLAVAGATLAGAVALASLRLRGSEARLRRVNQQLSEKNAEIERERSKVLKAAAELEARVDSRTHELADANRRLGDASRAKSEFLANMSHEIRTPLAAIQGYAELLLDPDLGQDEHLSHVHTIRRNGEHLLSVINDVLDLSKIEAGRMEVERIRCSPTRLLLDATSLLRARALEKGIALDVVLGTPVPETITGDPMRIRQVLMNLIGNAIKFTEHGSVTVEISLTRAGPHLISFAVSDTGIGMSDEVIARLFQPFMQADASTTRRFGGTGLGLVICQRLAHLMGGEITVVRRPVGGSCFAFTVPTGPIGNVARVASIEEARNEEVQPQEKQNLPSLTCRVLLAEDGPDNQRLISTHLRRVGATVEIVDNGALAFSAALNAERDGQPFDVVLMDMQMPVLDGYTAAAKLRSVGYRRPIVALTAHAMAGDKERCLAAGCDGYLTKPISRVDLVVAVSTWSRRASRLGEPRPVSSPRSAPSTTRDDGPLLSDLASDPEMADLVDEFVGDLPSRGASLERAVGDREALRRIAHQLKGSAGGYGFSSIGSAAANLEQAILRHDSQEAIMGMCSRLVGLCRRASRPIGVAAQPQHAPAAK